MYTYTTSVKENDTYDVAVCGGGPAGIAAALSAAREGVRVVLIETKHQLGGMGTNGLVSHWLGGRTNEGSWVVGGIFKRLSQEAARRGIAAIPNPADYSGSPYAPYGLHKGQLLAGIPFDPLSMAPFLEAELIGAGVYILYETTVADAVAADGELTRIITCGKDGLRSVRARFYVDATGDADLAAFSGCGYSVGEEREGVSPISLMIHLENVDEKALMEYVIGQDDPRFRKLLPKLRANGVECFNYGWMIFVKMNRDGYFMINGRILGDIDGTDPESRTRAYLAERAKVDGTLELFRKHFPGCSKATLRAVACSLGVRESRRIDGVGYMSVEDVARGRTFADTVGFSAYGWDLLNRSGTQTAQASKPPVVPIPFGIMVPKVLRNLICPGRAVHVERQVLGPLRVQAPVMAMGEAAGAAVSLAARDGADLRSIDAGRLRSLLAGSGAIVNAA